jgi:glycosyltransferase involved in cell wall biosynthesis
MSFISLIIPIYNVEAYLQECLDSCISQTFKDIEIICINDCSSDNSLNILQEFANNDKRIKIINHEVNKGLGAARNTGIEASTGQYCWFIDSDDYILLNSCEILHDVANQFKTDIIRFNRIDYDYNNITKERKILIQTPYTWPINEIFTKKDYNNLERPEVSACMYITSLKLIKKMKFREGVVHEDNDFTPILFSKAESIYNVNYSFYCVRQRLGSIQRNNNELSEKYILDRLSAIYSLCIYITDEKLSNKHFCTRRAISLFNNLFDQYNSIPELHSINIYYEIINIKKYIDIINKNESKKRTKNYFIFYITKILRKILSILEKFL